MYVMMDETRRMDRQVDRGHTYRIMGKQGRWTDKLTHVWNDGGDQEDGQTSG